MQLKIHRNYIIHLVTFTTNRCLNRSLTPPNRTKFRIPIQAIEEERRSDRLKDRKDQHTHAHTHKHTQIFESKPRANGISPNGSRATAPLKRCPKKKIYIGYRGPESGNPAVEGGPCVVIHRFVRKFHIRAVPLGRDGQNFKRSELRIKASSKNLYIYIYR